MISDQVYRFSMILLERLVDSILRIDNNVRITDMVACLPSLRCTMTSVAQERHRFSKQPVQTVGREIWFVPKLFQGLELFNGAVRRLVTDVRF